MYIVFNERNVYTKLIFNLLNGKFPTKEYSKWFLLQKNPSENLWYFFAWSGPDPVGVLQGLAVFSWGNDHFLKKACSHYITGSCQDLNIEFKDLVKIITSVDSGFWKETYKSWKKRVATKSSDPFKIFEM